MERVTPPGSEAATKRRQNAVSTGSKTGQAAQFDAAVGPAESAAVAVCIVLEIPPRDGKLQQGTSQTADGGSGGGAGTNKMINRV